MKRICLILVSVGVLLSCSSPKEDRYVFEEERILDTETGDEYYLNKMDTLTVVNIEGETSEIVVSAAPFAEHDEMGKMIAKYKDSISERKERMLEDKKERLRKQRIERYADYDDDELLKRFNELHAENAEFEQQMDVMKELVRREIVIDKDAPAMLEIEEADLDLDIEYDPSEEEADEL
ncbi:hypothetical protein [Pleomorphovibrio marinus]|uniref:hypothetical protein n=1 Tax=Pleomorphovibrio marinus TaxID=2164132 RepID=UPI000E0C2AE1|nr:hypothetical protein [Pleomorphovibrio marinus]